MNKAIITPDIRAVFFDAVGTLIEPDPPAVEVYLAAGKKSGIELDPALITRRFARAFSAEEKRDHVGGNRASEARERDRWRRIVAAVFKGHPSDDLFDELWDWFAQPTSWSAHVDVR